jgi:hypothetical protein
MNPTSRPSVSRRHLDVSDADLDTMILARLELLGVDLSVLPDQDSDAPADRSRILASARRFLRSTPGAIADFVMDPQEIPPVMYPAELGGRLPGPVGRGESR